MLHSACSLSHELMEYGMGKKKKRIGPHATCGKRTDKGQIINSAQSNYKTVSEGKKCLCARLCTVLLYQKEWQFPLP